jgi:hypothetical protein
MFLSVAQRSIWMNHIGCVVGITENRWCTTWKGINRCRLTNRKIRVQLWHSTSMVEVGMFPIELTRYQAAVFLRQEEVDSRSLSAYSPVEASAQRLAVIWTRADSSIQNEFVLVYWICMHNWEGNSLGCQACSGSAQPAVNRRDASCDRDVHVASKVHWTCMFNIRLMTRVFKYHGHSRWDVAAIPQARSTAEERT